MRFWSLDGLTPYEKARTLQQGLVELRIADRIPDTVLFLEHEPVITQGRGLQFTGVTRPRHMPVPEPLPPGIGFCQVERGGDLTYHGPGQLVLYPICKLDGKGFGPDRDVGTFLRKMEKIIIDEFASWGFESESRKNATGVWIQGKKVVSAGIAVRKWVTFHGLAINCVNDLSPFQLFSPCGFNAEIMTRLMDLIAEKGNLKCLSGWDGQAWRIALENKLARRMEGGMSDEEMPAPVIRRFSCDEAIERTERLLSALNRGPLRPGLTGGVEPGVVPSSNNSAAL